MNPKLADAAGKKKIFIHLSGNDCYDFLKIKSPLINLGKELWDEGIYFCPATDMTDYFKEEFNYFIFHGVPTPNFIDLLKKFDNKKLIWFMDDYMFKVPDYNSSRKVMDYTGITTLNYVLDRADIIAATTENLKTYLKRPEKTVVLPNLLDMRRFPEYKPRKEFKRYAYFGGNTHFSDIRLLEPMVNKNEDKEFVFFGMLPEGLTEYFRNPGEANLQVKPNKKNIGLVNIVPYDDYQNYVININADCGLAPLIDNKFNSAKSILKYMEYGALGIPCVASCVAPYCDSIISGVNGVLAYDDGWDDAIHAVNNKIGECAYNDVKENYSWQSPAREIWKKLFHQIINL